MQLFFRPVFLTNARTLRPANRGWGGGFARSLAPRSSALALLMGIAAVSALAQSSPDPNPANLDSLNSSNYLNLSPAAPAQPMILAPQTLHDKLEAFKVVALGPRAFASPVLSAGLRAIRPERGYTHEWRTGGDGFGRNYAHSLARHESLETARFATAALLHEDFRYRPSTHRNVFRRGFHAVGYTFIDRSDSGKRQIAFSGFAGAAASGFIPNLYLPHGPDSFSHAETRATITFCGLIGTNLLREFTPEMNRVAHKLRLPGGDVSVPKWWVSH